MSLQRQHILLSYFKTRSVDPVWDSKRQPPALPTKLTGRRSAVVKGAGATYTRVLFVQASVEMSRPLTEATQLGNTG